MTTEHLDDTFIDLVEHHAQRERPGDSVPAGGTETAARVADVILAFTKAADRGVSDIARDLGLSKAVVHRILQSLESRSLVQCSDDSKRYRLGVGAAAVGARAIRSISLHTAAVPILRRLREMTGETTTVSALVGMRRAYIDQVLGVRDIRMVVELGATFPLHAGASSRAILAFAPESVRQYVLAGSLERLTALTITDPNRLASELDQVRSVGYATSYGERASDAASVAAPIFDSHSEVVGSLSICGPATRFNQFDLRQFGNDARRGAHAISMRLGYTGPEFQPSN
jgi:DNA-binding IclR family transcriptional regulator